MSNQPCAYCGNPQLTWRNECSQWYCERCNKFMPQAAPQEQQGFFDRVSDSLHNEMSSGPEYHCSNPACRGRLDWVAQHQKWYCRTCGQYQ